MNRTFLRRNMTGRSGKRKVFEEVPKDFQNQYGDDTVRP